MDNDDLHLRYPHYMRSFAEDNSLSYEVVKDTLRLLRGTDYCEAAQPHGMNRKLDKKKYSLATNTCRPNTSPHNSTDKVCESERLSRKLFDNKPYGGAFIMRDQFTSETSLKNYRSGPFESVAVGYRKPPSLKVDARCNTWRLGEKYRKLWSAHQVCERLHGIATK